MSEELNQPSAAEAAVAAHYGLLLGIRSPWQVRQAALDLAGRRVEIVVVDDADAPVACPQCGVFVASSASLTRSMR